ncbi:cytochrome b5 domain containing 1 [Angomonas deanei]|nr:cytochrome b5 domain containing 1 [Angomonas deanei]|eukprot:EPY25338.1 cytochrome b5 domain containing 1 [Angomonas deanei]
MVTRYFTPKEVNQHDSAEDAYVSLNKQVLDLSPLIQRYNKMAKFAHLTKPLVQVAGTDISHWWDAESNDLKTCVDIRTGMRTYAQPNGRFPHIPTLFPDSNIDLSYEEPWWKDPQYVIGELTNKTRQIRIINTLTGDEVQLEVCAEETLMDIFRERYIHINAHALSYTWKRLDPEPRELDMTLTLDANGIEDETDPSSRSD